MPTSTKHKTTRPAAQPEAGGLRVDDGKFTGAAKTALQRRDKPVVAGERPSSLPSPSPAASAPKQIITPWPFEARAGSKQERLIGLLFREGGAGIAEISATLDWLPHTARAALTGLRRKGFPIERMVSSDGKSSVYRIVLTEGTAEKNPSRQSCSRAEA